MQQPYLKRTRLAGGARTDRTGKARGSTTPQYTYYAFKILFRDGVMDVYIHSRYHKRCARFGRLGSSSIMLTLPIRQARPGRPDASFVSGDGRYRYFMLAT